MKRLSTTVEEERSRQELLEHYINREEAATKKRQQLEKDLAHVRRDREKSQTSRTEVLTKLKADLLDVRDSTEHKSRTLKERYFLFYLCQKELFLERCTESMSFYYDFVDLNCARVCDFIICRT